MLVVVFWTLACSRNTTAVRRSSLALTTALQSQENTLKLLDKLAEQSGKATAEGKIAGSANDEIQSYVVAERATIEANRQQLRRALAGVDSYASGQSKQRESEVLTVANRAVMKSAETLRILDKKTEVIVDFLGNETFSRSEIKTLFESGEFTFNSEQVREGQRRFRPIVQKLFTFAEKYKDGFKKLKGEIIVTGYSDATPVEPGSRLYHELARRLAKEDDVPDPTSSDLNRKLSELRAGAVKGLLETLIRARKQAGAYPLDITISVLGLGEEIPRGLPASLPVNDQRRRIVTFYWVVLPEL